MIKKAGFSIEAQKSVERMIVLIENEKIRKHLLENSVIDKHGTLEEIELQQYSDFIRTKIAYDILQMTGEL